MTSSVTGTTSSSGTQATTNKSQNIISQNYNDFLTLLTTQLKNQDPLDPQDSSQFTSQISQLTSVQEQINTNKNLEQLIATVGGSQLSNVVNYIGRVVEAKGGNKAMKVTEGAQFVYDLPQQAASATITISDSAGKVVFTGDAFTAAGRNEMVWDGTSTTTGQAVPNGTYSYVVAAKDAAGQTITPTTYSVGVVTSVDLENGAAILALGDLKLPISEVTSIKTAQNLL